MTEQIPTAAVILLGIMILTLLTVAISMLLHDTKTGAEIDEMVADFIAKRRGKR